MKMFVKNRVFACLAVLLCALLLCSCDSAVKESEDTGFVRFAYAGEEGYSREIAVEERLQYPVESVYWAYTAVKIDGLHTVGESVKDASKAGTDVVKNGQYDDDGYALRPVKDGPASGLGLCSRKFSYGEWVFKLYGYKSYDGANRKFKDLIYTGETIEVNVRVDSSTPQEVNFKLERTEDYPEDGMLAFGTLYYTVPQDMVFYANSAIKVSFIEGADNLVAQGVGYTGGADAAAGTRIGLGVDLKSSVEHGGKNGFFAPDSYDFTVKVEYYSDSTDVSGTADETITVSSPRKFPVVFYAGITTVLSGNVDDVVINNGTRDDADVDVYVARIRKRTAPSDVTPEANPEWYGWFRTLEEACAAWGTGDYTDSTGSSTVDLIRDVDYGGVVEVLPSQGNGVHLWLSLKEHSLRNLTVVGDNYIRIADSRTISGSSVYCFEVHVGNGTVNSISDCDSVFADIVNVYLSTSGGDINIANSTRANIFHTGVCDSIKIIGNLKNERGKNLGYHVFCDVRNMFSFGSSTATGYTGYVELGPHVNIGKIEGYANAVGNAVIVGHESTVVGNINSIRDKKSVDGSTAMTAKEQNVWSRCSVTLKRNGATGGTDNLLLYGIEGMPISIGTYRNGYTKTNSKNVGFDRNSKCVYAPEFPSTSSTFIAIPGNVNLYCIFANSMGGRIFYVDNNGVASNTVSGGTNGTVTVAGAEYMFFDGSGNRLGNLTGVNTAKVIKTTDELYKAVYFRKDRDGSFNPFYVCDTGLRVASSSYRWWFKPKANTTMSGAYCNGVLDEKDALGGMGRGLVNLNNMKTFGDTNSWMKVSGTVWYYLINDINVSGRNGFKDWWLPNGTELLKIYESGQIAASVVSYSSSAVKVSGGGYTHTICGVNYSTVVEVGGNESYADRFFYFIRRFN